MAKDNHLAAGGEIRAKLKRSAANDYRGRGHSHISGSGKSNRYARLEKIAKALEARGTKARDKRVTSGSIQHATAYTFTYNNNFKIGQSPYVNQAHHLLPDEALSPKLFTDWQMKVLRAVPYDINEGTNIIFLPSRRRDSPLHSLPSHQGSHPKYTLQINVDMRLVRKKLSKVKKKDAEHKGWSPPADIKNDLKILEDKYWKLLTSGVIKPINEIIFNAAGKTIGNKRKGRVS